MSKLASNSAAAEAAINRGDLFVGLKPHASTGNYMVELNERREMSQRLRYTELAPEGMAALRGLEHYCNAETGLAPVLLELVRLRASLLNGCEYCVAMHSHELARHNEPAGRIAEVGNWRGSDAYTEHERAAFAWTEAVTNIQDGHASDTAYAAARAHFSEVDLVNLTIAITSINAWNRLAIAFPRRAACSGFRRADCGRWRQGGGGGLIRVENLHKAYAGTGLGHGALELFSWA